MTADEQALIAQFAALLGARLPAAIGEPLRDYSPVVLGLLGELVAAWDARKVEVTAGPGVVPTVDISG